MIAKVRKSRDPIAKASRYVTGTKEGWRRWQWNRIVELIEWALSYKLGRTPLPYELRAEIASKNVVYLVGPVDLDGPEAMRRGFCRERLFAIDLEEENVANVRKSGGVGVSLKLEHVLFGWPKTLGAIDVVVADYCGGLGDAARQLSAALVFAANVAPGVIASVNLLRGRDKYHDDNGCAEHTIRSARSLTSGEHDSHSRELAALPLKHRGLMWMQQCLGALWYSAMRAGKLSSSSADQVADLAKPRFYSYPSVCGNQWFDSVVCRNVLHVCESDAFARHNWPESFAGINLEMPPDNMARVFAALKACQTMLLQKKREPAA